MIQEASKIKTLVLVVEMDPMCRRVVERILEPRCRIITACEYDEIVTLLGERCFDTLFVDNDLPFPGVIKLFETAKRVSPRTRRVLMTGEHVENLQHYLRVGLIDAYVTRTTPGSLIEKEVIGTLH